MKLTKAQLLKATKNKIQKLGYTEFKDTITGANGLFIKVLDNNFFLSLGLEISGYYNSMFTASFYLSKTTRWSSIWGDIPCESFERVGTFLTKSERKEFLNVEFTKEGIIDAWWNGFEEKEIENFLKVVEITENRFLSQNDLFSKIENSKEVYELVEYASSVKALVNKNDINDFVYKFVPSKTINNIPIEWYKAAEKTIINKEGILNENTVKILAADAWRQNQLF